MSNNANFIIIQRFLAHKSLNCVKGSMRIKIIANFTTMKVDNILVAKLANLAKLEFDTEEAKAVERNLTNMLNFVSKLDELDVTGIAPLVYVNPETNVMRSDEVKMEITKEEALKNAPLADSDYFKVPKVIRKEN